MKITWIANDGYGRFGFKAETGEYDGVPIVDCLLFDGSPSVVSNDRLSAAAVLAFSDFVSGELELPKDVTPEMAGAIQEFLSPRRVFPTPISFAARALPEGEARLMLRPGTKDFALQPINIWGEPREVLLDIRPAAEWAGQVASVEEIVLASNAPSFGNNYPENDIRSIHGSIAVALIFAESLRARTLVLEERYASNPCEVDRVSQLLAPTSMGLELR